MSLVVLVVVAHFLNTTANLGNISSNCKHFEYESLVVSEVTANIWNSYSEVFLNLFEYFTFLDYNWKSFEYKSVVVSVVLSYFFKITANLLNIRSIYKDFEHSNITANLLNNSVVTENLLNSKPDIFMKILNISQQYLPIFLNISEKYLQIVGITSKSVVVSVVRSIYKLLEITANIWIIKQELFANLLNSKPVVGCLPIFLHILHFLNISNIYKSLQYNCRSIYKYFESNSEVFTNLLNTKSVSVSGVTINLLNMIENILNINKSSVVLSGVTVNNLNITASLLNTSSNCKCFEYESLVVLVYISSGVNNGSIFLNHNYKSFEFKSLAVKLQVFTNLFNHNSGDVSVIALHIFNTVSVVVAHFFNRKSDVITSEVFKNSLNISRELFHIFSIMYT
ncbi:hypothetical protein L873DRAFT_1795938 [Choiromyces venosus 120613-1]|uniref:Uncharacterized protein n=1 Tax=Choiromyces venosus 120613-1 TaxID=1336337 RepID=A0A3N4IV69_9PEZI|nr:hypothetical protein L873DRAFT_1795938 [Choiromyces venosus 120613-1]